MGTSAWLRLRYPEHSLSYLESSGPRKDGQLRILGKVNMLEKGDRRREKMAEDGVVTQKGD